MSHEKPPQIRTPVDGADSKPFHSENISGNASRFETRSGRTAERETLRHLPLPRFDEPLSRWLWRTVRLLRLARYRAAERRKLACFRCGEVVSTGSCAACRALVCERCSIDSIETGELARLCLDCARTAGGRPALPKLRRDSIAVIRRGARIEVVLAAVTAALAWRASGWSGVASFAAFLVQPGVLLGIVPLAWLLGAIATAVRRAVEFRG
jgi:hypothetical protein